MELNAGNLRKLLGGVWAVLGNDCREFMGKLGSVVGGEWLQGANSISVFRSLVRSIIIYMYVKR